MKLNDLKRSCYQYKKQQKLGYLKINLLYKILLSILFFLFIFLIPIKLIYVVFKKSNIKWCILSFSYDEPIKTIVDTTTKIYDAKKLINPKSIWIFPYLLFKDFLTSLARSPIWTLSNLDFFGALAVKISKYYGLKLKYNIENLIIFQEYSFYSSYLTRIFEQENGSLYNIMHGMPGKEATFFRFTKCFVWNEYFKNYYIHNRAYKKQFIIAISHFHEKLKKLSKRAIIKYDIIYAMQGDKYIDINLSQYVLDILSKISYEKGFKIAIKPHPIYKSKLNISSNLILLNIDPIEALISTKMLISHFSTMLFDAKMIDKKVLSFIEIINKDLVGYLEDGEIVTEKNILEDRILDIYSKNQYLVNDKIIANNKELIND